jgi:EPS-associated MarR family transcriptional regulator
MPNKHLDDEIRYRLIKIIESNPNISQRDLAEQLGISLGKANYCLKALIDVGWIKVGNFARSKKKLGYAYTLTPAGIKEKAVVTIRFLRAKQEQYERLKKEIVDLKLEASHISFDDLPSIRERKK